MEAIRVLLIEDTKIAQLAILNIFEDFNFQTDVAEDGKSALKLVQSNLYNLIFADIGLPDMDGFAVTAKIRENDNPNSNSIIVALTAHEGGEFRKKATIAGMNKYLTKPITAENIQSVLDEFKDKIYNIR